MSWRHAVIVCGHSVFTAADFSAPEADKSWCLLPYQKGEGPAHIEHIRAGVKACSEDPEALLIFAGGQSRAEAGPLSEASGYWRVARHYGWWGHPDVEHRAITEEFSMDSLTNLLFGICRFREFEGAYPETVSVVTWEFKRQRFDGHRDAIGWPASRFRFIGPNNPQDLQAALEGERQFLEGFATDPYGSNPNLVARRSTRNPFRRQHGYSISCPELAGLLAWSGPTFYPGPLPWQAKD